jgi:hypothetical protein
VLQPSTIHSSNDKHVRRPGQRNLRLSNAQGAADCALLEKIKLMIQRYPLALRSHPLFLPLHMFFFSPSSQLSSTSHPLFLPLYSSSLPALFEKKTRRTKSFQPLSGMSESIKTCRIESTFNRILMIKDSPPPTA